MFQKWTHHFLSASSISSSRWGKIVKAIAQRLFDEIIAIGHGYMEMWHIEKKKKRKKISLSSPLDCEVQK